jgi:hypothetical protein
VTQLTSNCGGYAASCPQILSLAVNANATASVTVPPVAGSSRSSVRGGWIGESVPTRQSPRAGLLTFWEQGCEQFEEEQEPGTEDMRRNRSEFKDRVEDILRQALGAFTEAEVAKLNELPEKKHFLPWHWEETIEMLLDLQLYWLCKKTTAILTVAKAPKR